MFMFCQNLSFEFWPQFEFSRFFLKIKVFEFCQNLKDKKNSDRILFVTTLTTVNTVTTVTAVTTVAWVNRYVGFGYHLILTRSLFQSCPTDGRTDGPTTRRLELLGAAKEK